MKLWILQSIWNHLNRYWSIFTKAKTSTNLGKPVEKPVAGFKNKEPSKSTKKNGKVYKFNACDISDSLSLSSPPSCFKNKRISKKSKENRKNQNKESPILVCQERKKIQTIFQDLSSEISSIHSKKSEDSCKTVKQYLIALDPKLKFVSNRVVIYENKVRKRQQTQARLTLELFGHKSKGKLFPTNITMKKVPNKCPPVYQASKQESLSLIKEVSNQ